jgi:saccharopine dehydrogenase-like NADP-dependent oxidoreductase
LLQPAAIKEVLADADLVIGAAPVFLAHQMLGPVIEPGKDLVDLSFGAEDPFAGDEKARENGVTAMVDAGVAPGMSNLFLGHHAAREKVSSFACYVGGLPVERKWPFEYKAPFSPVDVIEEYLRPARMKEHGKIVVKEALTGPEMLYFPGIGTLEAFNTDGLRTLLHTMEVPNMLEKTLRYPGHRALMMAFRETGLFNVAPVKYGKTNIRPIDITATKLLQHWKLEDTEHEFTAMRVQLEGERQYEYNLLDFRDRETGLSSMARSTGFTATATARMFLEGKFEQKGIQPLEYVGAQEEAFQAIMAQLEAMGVHWKSSQH